MGGHSAWLQGLRSPLIKEDEDGGSKELKLRFDVSEYAPEEIMVKTVDNKLLVHAKHEEIGDGQIAPHRPCPVMAYSLTDFDKDCFSLRRIPQSLGTARQVGQLPRRRLSHGAARSMAKCLRRLAWRG